jgi:peptide/nickel transport system substrate-binding protein
LNFAVDKNAIAAIVTNGLTQPASQGAIPGVFGFNPTVQPYPYDPERARRLLKEAGYANGFDLTIAVSPSANLGPAWEQVAQYLAKVGIKAQLRQTPWANWMRQYVSGEWGETDAFSLAWTANVLYDAARPIEYFSCLKANPFFCAPEITPALKSAATEMDAKARERRLFSIQQDLHEIAPAILLVPTLYSYGVSARVKTFAAKGRDIDFRQIVMKE